MAFSKIKMNSKECSFRTKLRKCWQFIKTLGKLILLMTKLKDMYKFMNNHWIGFRKYSQTAYKICHKFPFQGADNELIAIPSWKM